MGRVKKDKKSEYDNNSVEVLEGLIEQIKAGELIIHSFDGFCGVGEVSYYPDGSRVFLPSRCFEVRLKMERKVV